MSRLVVDVVDNSLALTGPGPLYNVISAEIVEEIDRAGTLSLVVPASDERAFALVGTESLVRFRSPDGLTAYGRLQQSALTGGSDNKMNRTLSGQDLLGELLFPTTGPTAEYNNVSTASIINALLASSTFTAGSVSPSVTPTTIVFEGQTVLQALTTLAEQAGDHFRQGSTPRTLEWGVFGGAAVWRFTNVQRAPLLSAAPLDVSYFDRLEITEVSGQVENRLFPAGASGFDLRDASSSCTGIKVVAARGNNGAQTTTTAPASAGGQTLTVASATGFVAGKNVWIGTANNWAASHEYAIVSSVVGTTITINVPLVNSYAAGVAVIQDPLFYIEDTASQATYGVRENTPQFQWIGPLSNAATDLQRAADVLYYAAQARLLRYKTSYQSFSLSGAVNVPVSLRVGQVVRVVYKAAAAPFAVTPFASVDADFYVTRIARHYTADGRYTADITVMDVSRPTPNNERFVIFNLDTLRWVGARAGRGANNVTGGGLLTLSNNTTIGGGGVIALGGASITVPTSGTTALGADTLTATTTNNSGIANHTHALTCTDDGDTNPSTLLKSGPSGQLRLRKIGIGTASGSNTGDVTQAAGGDIFPNADARGLAARFVNPTGLTSWTAHFRPGETTGPGEGSLAAFAWQGAPFTTPVLASYAYANDYLRWVHSSAARFFLSCPITNSAAAWQNKSIWGRLAATCYGSFGLRIDDGTDNNYVEIYLDATAADGDQRLRFSYRSGGGAVVTNTAKPVLLQGSFVVLRLRCYYSAETYAVYGYSVNETGGSDNIANFGTPAISWCPTAGRVGLVGTTTAASNPQVCDWFYTNFG